MDYTARYGLEFNPFLKNSKEVLVETQEYKEVLVPAGLPAYHKRFPGSSPEAPEGERPPQSGTGLRD
ncbi:MAG: hypothetical protein ACLS7X_06505 [Mediterraneibacter gnavus]